MPFPNEHSARIISPGKFDPKSFRRKKIGKGISIVMGKLKGKTTMTAQAYRFPKNKFTPAQAKTWLKEHKIKSISFEAAKKDEMVEDSIEELDELETKAVGWDTIGIIEEMINQGQINRDDPWSFSAEDQKDLLGDNGDEWGAYANVHIGRDLTFERDNKSRYIYPVIKDGIVYKSALVQAKKKAETDENWAFHTIDRMLGRIADKEGIHTDSTNQSRADFFLLEEEIEDNYMQEKFQKTDEGYLQGRAIMTNIGVFKYVRPDGKVVRELRLPEEVFNPDSMKSFEMLPITDKHPPVLVDAENIKKFQAGFAGNDIRKDDLHLSAPMTITNPDTVMGINQEGHRAISCGYTVDLEDKSGVWCGVAYDAIQRNIRGNHIAVNIDGARAGDAARIKMDDNSISFDAISVMDQDKKFKQEVNNIMKKIKIDGVEYEAEETVIKAYQDATKKVDELEKAKEETDKTQHELQAKHDTLEDENKELKKDNEELKKQNPDKVKEDVKARITLMDTAKKAGVEVTEDVEDVEDVDIKKAVILKAFPKTDNELEEFKKKLDEADAAYIDARFEGAVENLKERGNIEDKNKEDLTPKPKTDEKEDDLSADEHRDKMIERLENNYKPKEDK